MKLPPGATVGMAVGAQITQTCPATIVTTGVGTKVHRGVHSAGAAVGRGHGVGWHRRRRFGMCSVSLTQGAMRFLGQALEGFGLVGAVAFGFGGARAGLAQPEPSPRAWAGRGAK